jgi:hypothetical protein
MSTIQENLKTIVETSSDYAKINMRLISLKLSEKLSNMLSGFFTLIILVVVFTFALIMISIGLAKWIAFALDNEWVGFFIVGGIYILAGIMLVVMKKTLIKEPVLNAIVQSMFAVERKAEDEVEELEDKLVDKLDNDDQKKNPGR